MENNVRIREIAVYHPDKILDNNYYIEHFKKQGKDVKNLLEKVCGRDKRYVIDPKAEKKENSLTMQIEAAKKVLEKSELKGSDMDMVIVATQIPEYVVPAGAVIVHRAINGKRNAFCYDINANCTSMLFALENTYRYLESNHNVNRVLIVGGEYTTQVHNPENELGYGVFGDAACAIILERTEEQAGLIDSDFFVNDNFYDKMIFPHCGMSNIYESGREEILSTMEGVDCDMDDVCNRIKKMMGAHHLGTEDISVFCFSQFLLKNMEILREEVGIPDEKSIYIGDVYGYTGVTSPFLALNKAIEEEIVKHGDYIMFWTIGAGMQHLIMLVRY